MRNLTLIVIPTFNERENIARLIGEIRARKVPADILVVDDDSPDGTGQIVKKIAQADKSVYLLSRREKAGLGRAYAAGFTWGLQRGYQKLISMDADFSHPVGALAKLIALCRPDTVAIGSRYIKGGKIVGWKWPRYLNSWGANLVTRALLQISAQDATAGYKCYPARFLKQVDFSVLKAAGYAFQPEMLLKAQDSGFKLVETPITFVDRQAGESKIHGELVKSGKVVFALIRQSKSNRQLLKFLIVGAINTGVDWVVFFLLRTLFFRLQLNLPSLGGQGGAQQTLRQLAKAGSFVVSATSSYIMNRTWTFRSEDKKIGREAAKFFLVATGGLVLNSLIFYLITAVFRLPDILGLVIATAIVLVWNFLMNKKWTFRDA